MPTSPVRPLPGPPRETVAGPPAPARRHPVRRALAVLVTLVALAFIALLAGHGLVPERRGLGSALDSVLPWYGGPIAVTVVLAALARSRVALTVALVGVVVWAVMFGPDVLRQRGSGSHDLRIVTLNVGAANQRPQDTIRAVTAAGPDVVVLQELTGANLAAADTVLDPGYAYRGVAGTVGVWSKLPLSATRAVDIRIGWTRGLRTTVATAHGPVRLYAVHLASARPGATSERDQTLAALAALVDADGGARLIVAGDLNTATTDRRLAELGTLRETQTDAGAGFGFTFPAGLPMIRPDHILQRGLRTTSAWVLQSPGSDHRAALADLDTSGR